MLTTAIHNASTTVSSQDDARDVALLRQVAAGDRQAFDLLYHQYGRPLAVYLAKVLGQPEQVEDIVHDVMLAIWQQASTYQPTGCVSAWIFSIAHHKALQARTAATRQVPEPYSAMLVAYDDTTPEDVLNATLSPSSPLYTSLPSVHYHHGQFWAGTPAHFLAHLAQDFDYRADDVWLSSYPRSGTTWTYELLSAVLYEGDIAALQQAQREGMVMRFLPIEIGSAASVPERLSAWGALPSPRVIPTHVPSHLYSRTILERHGKRVYVVRHPKDVAVSFYHLHRSHQLLGYYQGTWDDFFTAFLTGQVVYGSWFEHTLGWWAHLQEHPDNVLVLFYEDMQHDLPAHIRRLGTFLGKDLSAHAVAAIAAHCSFESMSANPFTNREGSPMMDFSVARFLRKGVVGDWRHYFTAEQNARFQAVWDQKMGGTALGQRFAL